MIFHKRLFISNTFDTATILNENKIFFGTVANIRGLFL